MQEVVIRGDYLFSCLDSIILLSASIRGIIYGFATTGAQWRMLKYDRKLFSKTEVMMMVFDAMSEEKERWLNDYSTTIDCFNMALDSRDIGIMKKDMVVEG